MKKKMFMTVTAAALAGVLLVGGSFALLTDTTEAKVNVFSVGDNLSGELKEPLWDGENFTAAENQVQVPAEEADWGVKLAVDFVPGRNIPKDPAVANTSAGTGAWVGLTIEYSGGASSKAAIEAFADIDWNTTDWAFNEDYTVAYYQMPLAAGECTETLFNRVLIDEGATFESMKGFEIEITAYLAQEENFDNAKSAMAAAFETVFPQQ